MKKWTMLAMVAVLVAVCAVWGFAGALTAARDTPQRSGHAVVLGVASNETLWAGAMVAMNSGGYAVPASDATGLKVIGRANATAVGGTVNAATSVTVARGIFRWTNGDTFTTADVGALAFVEDDQTVQKAASATYDIIAGVIVDVDSDGVWVDTYNIGAQGSSAPATLAVTGNATVGGTLGATGVATFDAESVHNGGIDADYLTTDAAAGVDTKTAGTLLIGAATATKVEIADAGVETEVQGGLDVQQYLQLAYVAKTANYTNALTDCVITYNTSAVTTNTLPEASTALGRLFVIALQDDDGDLVVNTDGTDTFDGTNNKITFADAGDSLAVMATAANVYTIIVNVGGTLSTQ